MQRVRNQRIDLARLLARSTALLFLLVGTASAYASTTSGTVDSVHKYAWSNVGGYVNFAPSSSTVTVTDSALSGYVWSANDGWINLAPANGGVTNDGRGTLGGFAWDSAAGWVSFAGVTIDANGRFHGTATGANEAITFDCANCDVETDWRHASVGPTHPRGSATVSPNAASATSSTATIDSTPSGGGSTSTIAISGNSVSTQNGAGPTSTSSATHTLLPKSIVQSSSRSWLGKAAVIVVAVGSLIFLLFWIARLI
jgi:hypothetical protein